MLQGLVARLGERLNLSGPVDTGSIYLVRWLCEMYVELNESCLKVSSDRHIYTVARVHPHTCVHTDKYLFSNIQYPWEHTQNGVLGGTGQLMR